MNSIKDQVWNPCWFIFGGLSQAEKQIHNEVEMQVYKQVWNQNAWYIHSQTHKILDETNL